MRKVLTHTYIKVPLAIKAAYHVAPNSPYDLHMLITKDGCVYKGSVVAKPSRACSIDVGREIKESGSASVFVDNIRKTCIDILNDIKGDRKYTNLAKNISALVYSEQSVHVRPLKHRTLSHLLPIIVKSNFSVTPGNKSALITVGNTNHIVSCVLPDKFWPAVGAFAANTYNAPLYPISKGQLRDAVLSTSLEIGGKSIFVGTAPDSDGVYPVQVVRAGENGECDFTERHYLVDNPLTSLKSDVLGFTTSVGQIVLWSPKGDDITNVFNEGHGINRGDRTKTLSFVDGMLDKAGLVEMIKNIDVSVANVSTNTTERSKLITSELVGLDIPYKYVSAINSLVLGGASDEVVRSTIRHTLAMEVLATNTDCNADVCVSTEGVNTISDYLCV